MHIALLVGNHWGVYHQLSLVIDKWEQLLLATGVYIFLYSPGLPYEVGRVLGSFINSLVAHLFR